MAEKVTSSELFGALPLSSVMVLVGAGGAYSTPRPLDLQLNRALLQHVQTLLAFW